MGNLCSVNWKNKDASAYGAFLVNLFGNPAIYVKKEGGLVLWYERQLVKDTLFGTPVCFKKVMVLDSDLVHDYPTKHTDFLHVYIKVPIDAANVCVLQSVIDIFGYDQMKQCMVLRCNCLGKIIVTASIIVDALVNKKDIKALHEQYDGGLKVIADPHSKTGVNMDLVKKAYEILCKNLLNFDEVKKEGWADQPWYALARQGEPYTSYYAHDVEAVRGDDAAFYDDLDSFDRNRGESVFAQAPTAKPSVENLINFPRYANNGKYEKFTAKQIFKQKAEHLIEFPKVERYSDRAVFRKPKLEHLVQMAPSCKGACARRVGRQASERFQSVYPLRDSASDVRKQLGIERLVSVYPGCQTGACLKNSVRKELGVERLDVVNNATNDRYAIYSPEIQALYTPVKGVLPPKNLERMSDKQMMNAVFLAECMDGRNPNFLGTSSEKSKVNAVFAPEYLVVKKKV